MKSRIGKLEGDNKTSKRLQESLGKHVKMLENSLKRERENFKKLQAGESIEEPPTTTNKAEEYAKMMKCKRSRLLKACWVLTRGPFSFKISRTKARTRG